MYDNLGPLVCNSTNLNSNLNTNDLNICYFNAQSIVPNNSSMKFHEIRHLFEGSNYDIIGVTETWLRRNVPDGTVAINGFNIFSNDRCCSSNL